MSKFEHYIVSAPHVYWFKPEGVKSKTRRDVLNIPQNLLERYPERVNELRKTILDHVQEFGEYKHSISNYRMSRERSYGD